MAIQAMAEMNPWGRTAHCIGRLPEGDETNSIDTAYMRIGTAGENRRIPSLPLRAEFADP
jgi:hypothetical protein